MRTKFRELLLGIGIWEGRKYLLRLVTFREKPGEARPTMSGVARNGRAARRRRCRVGEEARRRSSPSIQICGVARERRGGAEQRKGETRDWLWLLVP